MQRRPKGEGSIQKLSSGLLKMTISIGIGIDGKQKTKQELMDKVAELR